MNHASLALAVVLLLLASCGDDGRGTPSTLAETTTVNTPPQPRAAAAATTDRFRTLVRPGDPGCSVAVGHEGDVVYAEGFGTAVLESGAAITAETSFDIASTSKQFTGLAVLLAAQDGDLDLSDDIRRWVPELLDYGRPPVRLGQMLHHQSGLPDYVDLLLDLGFGYLDRTTTQDALDVLATGPRLDFEPGSSWAYSNSGYFLLGGSRRAGDRQDLARLPRRARVRPARPGHDHGPGDADRGRGGVLRAVRRRLDSGRLPVGAGGRRRHPDDPVGARPLGRHLVHRSLRRGGAGGPAGRRAHRRGISVRRRDRDIPGHLAHDGAWGGFTAEFLVDPSRRVAVAISCNRPDLPDRGPALLDLWTRALS